MFLKRLVNGQTHLPSSNLAILAKVASRTADNLVVMPVAIATRQASI